MFIIQSDILSEDIQYCASRSFMIGLKGKSILVIGSSGMIGNYIVNVLSSFDCVNIIAFSRGHHIKARNIYNVFGDICSFNGSIPKFDICLFAAGKTDRKIFDNNPEAIYEVNTTGLHNALKLAKQNHCTRFVYISSASVYGNVNNVSLLNEESIGIIDFNNPASVYSESKRMGECICSCYMKQYNLDIRIIRPFHMYGAGMLLNNNNLVFESIKRAINQTPIEIVSTGDNKRNLTYLRDMIRQILMIMAIRDCYRTINLGSENNVTVKDWAYEIGRQAKVDVHIHGKLTNGCDMCPDLAKLRELNAENDPDAVDLNYAVGVMRTLQYFKQLPPPPTVRKLV